MLSRLTDAASARLCNPAAGAAGRTAAPPAAPAARQASARRRPASPRSAAAGPRRGSCCSMAAMLLLQLVVVCLWLVASRHRSEQLASQPAQRDIGTPAEGFFCVAARAPLALTVGHAGAAAAAVAGLPAVSNRQRPWPGELLLHGGCRGCRRRRRERTTARRRDRQHTGSSHGWMRLCLWQCGQHTKTAAIQPLARTNEHDST